ncbi:MAG: hypothetical protein R3B72_00590 [Polyangiaceae bacterium]
MKTYLTPLPLAFFVLVGFTSLTPAALECEHAAIVLEDCCPGFDIEGMCTVLGGCTEGRPLLTVRDSECIQDLSCADLLAVGDDGLTICERAQNAFDEALASYDDDYVQREVCR